MSTPLHPDVAQSVIVMTGYLFTLATSGPVVRHFISGARSTAPPNEETRPNLKARYHLGAIIGKCENLLTLSLILAGAHTGLALIFSAKSIIRSEDIKKDPNYYLGGTLVNFTYSVMMGFMIRIVAGIMGHPLP